MSVQSDRPDKRPGSPLTGAYGHPIHPILVTIPIGAWIASFVFDIASHVVDDGEAYARGAEVLVAVGVIGAVLAAVWGLLDYLRIPQRTQARRTGTIHLLLNDVVLLAFAVSWIIRAANDEPRTPAGLIVLSAVALVVLGVSGFLGGKLAYRYGVRVVTDEDQADGYTAPIGERAAPTGGR